jgi:ACS family hexuronate transporter-like MFS transporter
MGEFPASSAPRIAPWRWGVVGLLFLATVINYMDRMAINATSDHIIHEFQLSEEQYGWIEFAFGMTFGIMQFFAGYLADRFSVRWMYAGSLLLWSAAGFFTGLAQTFALLTACRILLGVGESFNWPCAISTVRRVIPRETRSFANSVFQAGTAIGAVLTPLLVRAIAPTVTDNWRPVFLWVGGGGAFWVVLWLAFVRGERAVAVDTPSDEEGPARGGPAAPFFSLFNYRLIWIATLVGATVNVCWHLYRIFLVRHLKVDLHYDVRQQQNVLAVFYLAADLGSIAIGYLTGSLIGRGRSVVASRKLVTFGTAALCLLTIPAMLSDDPWVFVPLLCLAGAGSLGGFAAYFALTQDVSPRHTAQVVGFSGAVSWALVACSGPLTGAIADRTGTYVSVFVVVGCVPLLGALIGLLWPADPAKERPA